MPVSSDPIDGLSPRVRGNHPAVSTCEMLRGLSPRVRGNRQPPPRTITRHGLSPRVRGNRFRRRAWRSLQGVYPRVCGGTRQHSEAACLRRSIPACAGEPKPEDPFKARSIPACAGEPAQPFSQPTDRVYPRVCGGTPPRSRSRSACFEVYPRVCGGTRNWRWTIRSCEGLSPRVRGNRSQPGETFVQPGSIPACAGEP